MPRPDISAPLPDEAIQNNNAISPASIISASMVMVAAVAASSSVLPAIVSCSLVAGLGMVFVFSQRKP